MNREQAEKWIVDNKKAPLPALFCGAGLEIRQKWACLPTVSVNELSKEVYANLDFVAIHLGYDSEDLAREDLIQALMKLDEPEVDVKALFKKWLDENPNVAFPTYEEVFIAGFEAAKRSER